MSDDKITDQTELRECPFCKGPCECDCGSELNMVAYRIDGSCEYFPSYQVQCCKCLSKGGTYRTKSEATVAWNHRPIEDALKAENARMKRAIAAALDAFEQGEDDAVQAQLEEFV